MNKVSWGDVEAGLRERRGAGAMHDAGTFSADFKARARLVRQDVPEETGSKWSPVFRWGYASLAVAALVVAAIMLWPTQANLMTQVKSLRVMAPHSGVIIMNDEGGQGTVVWITDMETDGGDKG